LYAVSSELQRKAGTVTKIPVKFKDFKEKLIFKSYTQPIPRNILLDSMQQVE
jgi:hypothetical protein